MLPNLASEYLNSHRLLSKIEDALNTCIAGNLESPEAYIASYLMNVSPSPCVITKVALLPGHEILYTVKFCETLHTFKYALDHAQFAALLDICVKSISVSELTPARIKEYLPSLAPKPVIRSATPSSGSRLPTGQKDRPKADAKAESAQENAPLVCTEPLYFDADLPTPLHGINIIERINGLWPAILKRIDGDRELGIALYNHFMDIGTRILASPTLLELRRRATNVSTLTIRCATPIFVVLSWGSLLTISLTPVDSSLLPFQALMHAFNTYAAAKVSTEGAGGAAAKKKPDAGAAPDISSLFPILIKQEPNAVPVCENPLFTSLINIKPEYLTLKSFTDVKPTVTERSGTTTSGGSEAENKSKKYACIVAIFRAFLDMMNGLDENWRTSAKIQLTVDLQEVSNGMKCVTATADDALHTLQEKADAVYPNCRTQTPGYAEMVGFLDSFKTRPLLSEFELLVFNILMSQNHGHLELSFVQCDHIAEVPADAEYNPVAELAQLEAAQAAAPKKGAKVLAPATPAQSAGDKKSDFTPPIVYQTYTKDTLARHVLTSLSQNMALTEIPRQLGTVTSAESLVQLSVSFDSTSLVSILNQKLAKNFANLSPYIKSNLRQYTKTPAICRLNQSRYLDTVCKYCHDLEPAKALCHPTTLALRQHIQESSSSTALQTPLISFRGGDRAMGITPRAGSKYAGPGSQFSASDCRAAICAENDGTGDSSKVHNRSTLPDELISGSRDLSNVEEVASSVGVSDEKEATRNIVSYAGNESMVLTTEVAEIPPEIGDEVPAVETTAITTAHEGTKGKGKEKEKEKDQTDKCYISRVTCAIIYGYYGFYISTVDELDELINIYVYLRSGGRLERV